MKRIVWLHLLLTLATFVAVQGGIPLLLSSMGIAGQDYSNVLINTVFLIACVGLVRVLNLSAEDIGLKVIKDRMAWHVGICLTIFLCYMAFYVFGIRISNLRPLTSRTNWGLLNYLLVAFAEETYWRGICYSVIQKGYTGRMAVLISALLFGLAHVRQGLGMIPRFFTGWLWGTVRYSTGMIFLLIIPVHFAYNVMWLLFEGNWEHPPMWAQLFPLFEFALGMMVMAASEWAKRRGKVQAPR